MSSQSCAFDLLLLLWMTPSLIRKTKYSTKDSLLLCFVLFELVDRTSKPEPDQVEKHSRSLDWGKKFDWTKLLIGCFKLCIASILLPSKFNCGDAKGSYFNFILVIFPFSLPCLLRQRLHTHILLFGISYKVLSLYWFLTIWNINKHRDRHRNPGVHTVVVQDTHIYSIFTLSDVRRELFMACGIYVEFKNSHLRLDGTNLNLGNSLFHLWKYNQLRIHTHTLPASRGTNELCYILL